MKKLARMFLIASLAMAPLVTVADLVMPPPSFEAWRCGWYRGCRLQSHYEHSYSNIRDWESESSRLKSEKILIWYVGLPLALVSTVMVSLFLLKHRLLSKRKMGLATAKTDLERILSRISFGSIFLVLTLCAFIWMWCVTFHVDIVQMFTANRESIVDSRHVTDDERAQYQEFVREWERKEREEARSRERRYQWRDAIEARRKP